MSRSSGTDPRHDADRHATGDSAAQRCLPLLTEYPDGVIYEVSPRDHMYNDYDPSETDGYFSLGRAALDCIRVSLLASQKERPESILDLPSGHGRVLRYLKAEFPNARLAACDIDHDAVNFCATTFGAAPIYGQEHPGPIGLEDKFDLIWCGSLFTHLDQHSWKEFLDVFESVLVVGGILVFTTCGRKIAAMLANGEQGATIMKEADARAAILESCNETGFGYANYSLPDEMRDDLSLPETYGISLAEPSWVCRLLEARPGLQLVNFTENRWASQDVLTCMRVENIGEAFPFRVPLRLHRSVD